MRTPIPRTKTRITDPSNEDPAFARSSLRARMRRHDARLPAWIAARARAMGGARACGDFAIADRLAASCVLRPWGEVRARACKLLAPPEPVAAAALTRVLATVGGRPYPPRGRALRRLHAALVTHQAPAMTLGGCLIRRRGDAVWFLREPAAVAGPLPLGAGESALWDGRFRVALGGSVPAGVFYAVAALRPRGLARVRAAGLRVRLPARAAWSLPALYAAGALDAVLEVPHLSYKYQPLPRCDTVPWLSASFEPRCPLAGAAFVAA